MRKHIKDEDAINAQFRESYNESDRVFSAIRDAVFDGFVGGWLFCRNKMLVDCADLMGIKKTELNKLLMEKQRGQK